MLGHEIRVHSDHKNLTYNNCNTDTGIERVMRWRLILEEFGPQLHYIKADKNIVADALSCLGIDNAKPSLNDKTQTAECFALTKSYIPSDIFPVQFKQLQSHTS